MRGSNPAILNLQSNLQPVFIDAPSLTSALSSLYGQAGHLLKIWFTLKHMGLAQGVPPVKIDTGNSTPSLQRLYLFGDPEGRFFVPFAHTTRYLTMRHDASRSIIQTTIQRWGSSGSVVTCDPTDFLEIESDAEGHLQVSPSRKYPLGLGQGESGFALKDNARLAIPITAFAIWYGRKSEIPPGEDPKHFLIAQMLEELNISSVERAVVFADDALVPTCREAVLSDEEIFQVCNQFITGGTPTTATLIEEDFQTYERRIKSMVTDLDKPDWLRVSPQQEVSELIESGETAILMFGPPRTGKTRRIDALYPRDSDERETIQIHDGWGYDQLVEGLKPTTEGAWEWIDGPLKTAIESGKKAIVLEEINRTEISQALGEVFSLIEKAYRGERNAILLRGGAKFWIPEDTMFFMTMNTIDKSTEEIDDALLGRMAAVEFPPRVEDLQEMLTESGVPEPTRNKLAELFTGILKSYQLGHGYFSEISGEMTDSAIKRHYRTRIRPVLQNFFGNLRKGDLAEVDNLVGSLFAGT